MMNQAIPAPKEINIQGLTKEVSELVPLFGKSAKGTRTKNVHIDNTESVLFLPILKEGLRALNIVDGVAPAESGTDILLKYMEDGSVVAIEKIVEGKSAIKTDKIEGIESFNENGEIALPFSPDKNQLDALIRIIGDVLKKHGFEDDRISEILSEISEINDKGLVTVKEDTNIGVMGENSDAPGNILIYDHKLPMSFVTEKAEITVSVQEGDGAEALGVERVTNAVYEMPADGMKPMRQEEPDLTGKRASLIKSDLLSAGEDKNIGVMRRSANKESLSEKGEIVLPFSPDKDQLDTVIKAIGDTLKKQGFEDDRISEILSEIKDKELVTVKENRAPVISAAKSISGDDAEDPIVKRITNIVYKVPMSPISGKAEISVSSRQYEDSKDVSVDGQAEGTSVSKNLREGTVKIIPSDSNMDKEHGKEYFPSFIEKGKVAAKGAFMLSEGTDVAAYGGSSIVNKASDTTYINERLLVNQIVEQLPDAAAKGFGRVKINLSPPQLGSLDMDIIIRENKVQIVITAERQDIQQALQTHADRLRNALHEQGLRVDSIDVLLQGGPHGREHGSNGGNFWLHEENSRAEGGKKEEDKPSPLAPPPFVKREKLEGAGGGISLFI